MKNKIQSPMAVVRPMEVLQNKWTGGLWKERFDTCANVTIPHIRSLFEDESGFHVVENFRVAAQLKDGFFKGTPFGDGDFYKWMEGAIYVAAQNDDQEMLQVIDGYIELIGQAQLPDGYISTKQIIGERQGNGVQRQGDINDFEVYNIGHLLTAACMHYKTTEKTNFMEVADKAAQYLKKLYEEAARTGVVKTAVCPSHYMGLIEMYRTTGNEDYLKLAELSINLRDSVKNGLDDNQDRYPLRTHEKIVGHAVRSTYLYAGVADLYAETGEEALRTMLDKVWSSCVNKKLYITGGVGALYNGVSPYGNFWKDQKMHQAFGYEYQLPNITAYNETCAALGNVFWNYRMFMLEPEVKYYDIIERTLLNVALAAISLEGKEYFYENMLRRAKKLDYELCWPLHRVEKISSFCCPPNLMRTIAQSSQFAYTLSENTIWTGIYGECEAKMNLENGASFTLCQKTNYPFDGEIVFTAKDVQKQGTLNMMLRIPGWVQSGYVQYGEERVELTSAEAMKHVAVTAEADEKLEIKLVLDMPARFTEAHPLVEECAGQVAVERGPLVYCMETPDSTVESLDQLILPSDACFTVDITEIAGRKVPMLKTTALMRAPLGEGLYRTYSQENLK
ncbi:MAG: glycoside hydrolase family 127 protein, partial [Firmicutes bacterium]|nr:glycoside hydrolase family 127 protein [Bacillota bacterium]